MGLLAFTVKPNIPAPLAPLEELSRNLWISWNYEAILLFMRLDHDAWLASRQSPTRMLGLVPQKRLDEAAADDSFLAALSAVHATVHAVPRRRTLVQGTDRPGHRVLLDGVRHRRVAARSTRAGSASSRATTSRPPPTWGCRWSASGCSTARATSSSTSTRTGSSRSPTPRTTGTTCPSPSAARDGRARHRAAWTSPAKRRAPGCGRCASARSRCTSSTPTSRPTPQPCARSRPRCTAATARTASGRRSSSAWAASGPWAPSASSPR